jgi:hypothetical protein
VYSFPGFDFYLQACGEREEEIINRKLRADTVAKLNGKKKKEDKKIEEKGKSGKKKK